MGERIRAARELLGLTQAQLAARLGQKQQTIGKWESGENNPKAPQMVELVKVLGVTADHLLGIDAAPPPVPVERAIGMDERLSAESRKALLRAYRSMVDLAP
jgi:transcriptional regulator with XRE-family HTH domain